jgi:hypothetical protein
MLMDYPHGMISWTDLSVPDVDAAREFYTALMGWDADDVVAEGQVVYTMFRNGDKMVAGLAKQPEEMSSQGIPPLWTTYVNVADVDTIAAAFTDNGGQLLVEPMDVMDSGRMAYGMDPTGAAIGFWQPGTHQGADGFNETGFLTWNELTTRDLEAAISFYEAILPWKVSAMEMGDFTYHMIMMEDHANGGIMVMDDTWPTEIPAHWMVYFRVADTDEAVAKVTDLGGVIPVPPFDTPQGKVAVINDPQGGTFSIVGPAPETA